MSFHQTFGHQQSNYSFVVGDDEHIDNTAIKGRAVSPFFLVEWHAFLLF